MATTQALMLSGRYRTELLCSHWSLNKSGVCLLSSACTEKESITHMLVNCVALSDTRVKLMNFTKNYTRQRAPIVAQLVESFCNPKSVDFIQFLLDCSVLPAVIALKQQKGEIILTYLFDITRTWVYTIHKQRLKILGRWNLIWTHFTPGTVRFFRAPIKNCSYLWLEHSHHTRN